MDGPEAKGKALPGKCMTDLFDGGVPAPQEGVERLRPGDAGDGEAEGTEGRLIATRQTNLARRDLRELMDEDNLRAADWVQELGVRTPSLEEIFVAYLKRAEPGTSHSVAQEVLP